MRQPPPRGESIDWINRARVVAAAVEVAVRSGYLGIIRVISPNLPGAPIFTPNIIFGVRLFLSRISDTKPGLSGGSVGATPKRCLSYYFTSRTCRTAEGISSSAPSMLVPEAWVSTMSSRGFNSSTTKYGCPCLWAVDNGKCSMLRSKKGSLSGVGVPRKMIHDPLLGPSFLATAPERQGSSMFLGDAP
jgi:hypothetical protein